MSLNALTVTLTLESSTQLSFVNFAQIKLETVLNVQMMDHHGLVVVVQEVSFPHLINLHVSPLLLIVRLLIHLILKNVPFAILVLELNILQKLVQTAIHKLQIVMNAPMMEQLGPVKVVLFRRCQLLMSFHVLMKFQIVQLLMQFLPNVPNATLAMVTSVINQLVMNVQMRLF